MLHILTLEAIKHILKIIEHKNEHSLSIKSRSLIIAIDILNTSPIYVLCLR